MERESKKIIRRLEAEGWVLVSVKGSHHKFKREGAIVIIPHPKKRLPIGTARAIYKAIGWL